MRVVKGVAARVAVGVAARVPERVAERVPERAMVAERVTGAPAIDYQEYHCGKWQCASHH